jgi:hypothetical protein
VNQNLIAATAGADHSDKEGYFVEASGTGTVTVCNAATDRPAGVIVSGAASGSEDSIALPGGEALVKLNGTVKKHDEIQIESNGTVIKNAGSGARTVVGQMLEGGVAGDLKRAFLYAPQTFAS